MDALGLTLEEAELSELVLYVGDVLADRSQRLR
jgi:hypothetical protein